MIKGFYTIFYEPVDSVHAKSGWYVIISENEHELKTSEQLLYTINLLETIHQILKKHSENIYKLLDNSETSLVDNLFLLEQNHIRFSNQLNKKFNFRNSEFSGCNNIVELERRISYFYRLLNTELNVYQSDVDKILDKINNVGYEKVSAMDILILNKV